MSLSAQQEEAVYRALDSFQIELPSWAFANTGTRFGKFLDPSAATTIDEKLRDAAEVHRFTGCCPSVAVHVLWDFPKGQESAGPAAEAARRLGIRIGSVSPNIFQDQDYKYGSLANPDASIRGKALDHILDSIAMAKITGSRDVTPWFIDGSNYPGTANMRQHKRWFEEGLRAAHDALAADQRLLIEYKPFEPAFYHTDIADWGMALRLAREAGGKARVLVDTGHHYQTQNIEQIVAWLLDDGMLGGFHLNDRRYADDDLTLGSIDPYQVFRIFHEIQFFEWETGTKPDIAFMVDQSHNLKPKTEEMIQTVMAAQEIFAKAAIVDCERLARHQASCSLIDAEECFKSAFSSDVRPAIGEWRRSRGLAPNPLNAFRESGYLARVIGERAGHGQPVASYA
ncbi:MAG: sugar isomerase [Acidobacteriota bacterium]|nr:sugar isomerase [Acidobacteriota bacterium]